MNQVLQWVNTGALGAAIAIFTIVFRNLMKIISRADSQAEKNAKERDQYLENWVATEKELSDERAAHANTTAQIEGLKGALSAAVARIERMDEQIAEQSKQLAEQSTKIAAQSEEIDRLRGELSAAGHA